MQHFTAGAEVLRGAGRMQAAVQGEGLSRREREVALAYAEGASHRDIAERLFIAPSTVRTHLGTIYRKLGVSSIQLRRLLAEPRVDVAAGDPAAEAACGTARRATVAIMPLSTEGAGRDGLAEGLVQDIITRLAKLRSLPVMSRGSVFALAERGLTDAEAGRLLNVDYLATGSLRRRDGRMSVAMELAEARTDLIIWADRFEYDIADTFLALDEIGDRIVASVASEIEAAEHNRAALKHPQSLNAWESFHLGLWHMYRFTAVGIERAQAFFQRAVLMDPTFARAHSGLSFTHFQNAFLLRPADRRQEVARALETAGRSLAADERDPSAHWAMGRALWLEGADGRAVAELETSVALSPNFTLGHYSLAFVNSQSGGARAAIRSADCSRRHTPFDPILFGMLGARAMALFRLGAYEEAADWAIQAAARPNAHVHIRAIAAHCLAVAGRLDEARSFARAIRVAAPGYRVDDYFAAFRFPPDAQALFRLGAARIGLD